MDKNSYLCRVYDEKVDDIDADDSRLLLRSVCTNETLRR